VARAPRSIIEACVRKRGLHRGALTAAHVAQYALAMNDLGHFPTAVEYADYWAVSERTAFAHRAGIAEVFGRRWQDVVGRVAAAAEDRETRSLGRITRFPVPAAASPSH
jgi:hypothetical protein